MARPTIMGVGPYILDTYAVYISLWYPSPSIFCLSDTKCQPRNPQKSAAIKCHVNIAEYLASSQSVIVQTTRYFLLFDSQRYFFPPTKPVNFGEAEKIVPVRQSKPPSNSFCESVGKSTRLCSRGTPGLLTPIPHRPQDHSWPAPEPTGLCVSTQHYCNHCNFNYFPFSICIIKVVPHSASSECSYSPKL